MPDINILTESELRRCVPLDGKAIDVVEAVFETLAGGTVVMPPIMRLDIEQHNGEIDVKTAYVPGLDSFAVKMSPGFFDNPKIGLPTTSGLMIVFSSETGVVKSLLLDNGYLTDVRTAAAGAVAAKHLSNPDIETVGVVGTGMQARLQIEALKLVRDFERVLVWGRDFVKAGQYADEMTHRLGIRVEPMDDIAALVADSQIVVTTTPSRAPVIKADWLHPGLHITAMGSDSEHKNELDPAIVSACTAFVCDTRAQSARLGELHHAIDAGAVPEDVAVSELGAVVSGDAPGRQSPDDITVCDLTGTGAQDTAISRLAVEKAAALGAGTIINS